ncbi:MAG: hypothetical protein AAGF33_17950 [Pseudomonadota bacterium]
MDGTQHQDLKRLGSSELVEDLFGLNLRGLRTIWEMIRQPTTVYQAARDPLWIGHYTPSIRLVFSLLALTAFFQFLWASEGTIFHDRVLDMVLASDRADTTEAALPIADELLNIFVGIFPFCYLAFQALFASILFIWGKGTSLVLRLRLYFLAIVPSVTVTTLSMFAGFVFSSGAFATSIALIIFIVTVDMLTAYRGGVAGDSVFGRSWRAFLLAVCSFASSVAASNAGFIVAIYATQ